MLVYDITNEKSFDNIRNWIRNIEEVIIYHNDVEDWNGHFCCSFLYGTRKEHSCPIFIRKEIETRKLERKSKQKMSRFIDLLYHLNNIISC